MSSLYQEKERLYKETFTLKEGLRLSSSYDDAMRLKERQDDTYKRWIFYKNIINAKDKIDRKH